MSALFKDWELGPDLDAWLTHALEAAVESRRDCGHWDREATKSREAGAPLSDDCIEHAPKDRAYVAHFVRQAARIREQIARRDADAARMGKASVRLKVRGR